MGGRVSQDFLRLVAVEDTTFTFTFQQNVRTQQFDYVEYSTDNGTTWTKIQNIDNTLVSATTPTILQGNSLYVKGKGITLINNLNNSLISSSGVFDAEGDVMSILGSEEFESTTYALRCLFKGSKVRKANNLILSASVMQPRCYHQLFYGCTNLTDAPIISYTSAATACCYEMFRNCTSLVNTQDRLPDLLADDCFHGLYNGCTSLVNAPVLPATSLAANSYGYMFQSCTSLKYIKCMALTDITASTSYTYWWVFGVPSGGTFVKNSAATWENTFNRSSIPEGWTVITEDS